MLDPDDFEEIDATSWRHKPTGTIYVGRAGMSLASVITEADTVTPPDLVAYAGRTRWQSETKSITVNGVSVRTDDTTRLKISDLRRRAEIGEVALPLNFKAENGWFDLDLAAVVAIDQAISAHVQSCYTIERQIAGDITRGVITETNQIDVAFRSDSTTRAR